MTTEEAIKELEILKQDYWDDDGYGHETKQYDDAMSALDMAIEALNQRWIPVTERLPEEGTFVLASYNSDEGTDVIMTYYNKYGFTRGLMTAWMPLPEPYKGGEE